MNWYTSSKKRLKVSTGVGRGRASRLNAHYKFDAPMIARTPNLPVTFSNSASKTRPLHFEPPIPQNNLVDQQSFDVMKLNRRFLDTGEDSPVRKEPRKGTNETLLETLQFSPSKHKTLDSLDIIDGVELEYFK